MNKVDEFYEKRTTLEEINRKLEAGYPIYVVSVLSATEPVKIEISLHSVFQHIDKKHFGSICWRLKRMLEDDVRKKITAKVIKELTEELEKIKKQVKTDFLEKEGKNVGKV